MQDTSFWRWLFSAIRLTIAALCVLATMAVIRWLVVTRGPGFDLKPLTTPDLISIAAGAIALAAFLVAFWFNRGARADGARIEKSNAYPHPPTPSSQGFKLQGKTKGRERGGR